MNDTQKIERLRAVIRLIRNSCPEDTDINLKASLIEAVIGKDPDPTRGMHELDWIFFREKNS